MLSYWVKGWGVGKRSKIVLNFHHQGHNKPLNKQKKARRWKYKMITRHSKGQQNPQELGSEERRGQNRSALPK